MLLASAASTLAASFVVTATDVAPPVILDNQQRAILRFAVANPVAGGPATVLLSSFGVRLEQATGAGLGTLPASSLFSSIEVYLDANASGAFEPATDTFVAALYSPDLAADGGLGIDLTSSEPADVQVTSGNTRTYFLVGRLNQDASAASPNAFRITHVASGAGASSAVNAGDGVALTLAAAPDVTSKVITATQNQAPTTTGLAEVMVFDNAAQGMIPLYSAFQDAEDASSQLTYALTGNTNAGLFSFAGIEAATGKLLLTYAAGVTGTSQLTVMATDTLGKSVTTSFQVRVIPFVTYSDFQVVHPNAGGPLDFSLGNGQMNLLSYAFFLNQGLNGGTLGLPRLQGVGNARIFSHLRPKQASDLFYNYQLSQDMQTWVPAVKNIDYYENTRDLGDGSVRVELLLLNGWQKAFMRVQTQLVGSPAPPSPPPPPAPLDPPSGGLPPPPPPPSTGIPILSSAAFPSQTILDATYTYSYIDGNTGLPVLVTVRDLATAAGMVVTDLDNDTFKDILVASTGKNTVAWFHNNHDGTFGLPQSSGPYPQSEGPYRIPQIISAAASGAFSVAAGDLDNDGLVDAVSGSLSFSNAAVIWYKRMANGSYVTQQPALSSNAQGAYAVEIADLDGNGYRDVVYSSIYGSKIMWCKNLGPTVPGGPVVFALPQILATETLSPWTLHVADLDGDGILDLATASISKDSFEWYKGNGNGTFGGRILLTPVDDQEFLSPVSVASGDIDGDGYVDLVGCYAFTKRIVWFKNNQNTGFAARQYVSRNVQDASSVRIGDLDGDGKPDVVATSSTDSRVSWYRNLGGGNFGDPYANQLVISNEAMGAFCVGVGDFDQDGKLDVASASQDDAKVAVYLNRGGQSALSTTNIAPSVILDGQKRAVLRVEVANRGVAGNDNARLDSVSLLLESSAGVPLTTAQANALIDSLTIYADTNDSGTFEAESDAAVAIVPYLSLNAGKLTVSVRGNALAAQIAPGTTRNYFVVPQMTANAASQSPNTFRMTHFTQGPGHSTARDAFSSVLLTVEASPVSSVVSSVSAAQTNSAPTTIGLPNLTVFDTAAASSVLVRNYFGDLEDGAAGLQYELTGNTNAGLLSFVGIDAAGKLVIRYRPGIAGSAGITVKATDSLGKSVSSTFTVLVSLANTFSNWSGGGGAAGQSGLLRYAFGLTPQGGDVAGWPKLKMQGKAKVMSHQKPAWATDLNYHYEVSQDLVTWTPAIEGVHFHEFSKDLPNALRQSDCVLLVNWPKAYLRVRAVLSN